MEYDFLCKPWFEDIITSACDDELRVKHLDGKKLAIRRTVFVK